MCSLTTECVLLRTGTSSNALWLCLALTCVHGTQAQQTDFRLRAHANTNTDSPRGTRSHSQSQDNYDPRRATDEPRTSHGRVSDAPTFLPFSVFSHCSRKLCDIISKKHGISIFNSDPDHPSTSAYQRVLPRASAYQRVLVMACIGAYQRLPARTSAYWRVLERT